jgi:hypothetical protein
MRWDVHVLSEWGLMRGQSRRRRCNFILSRVYGDYNRRGIGLTTGFIGPHTVTITVYTLYNSQQLSFFSCSEDYGWNSASTAATNSYGVPCHYSLTGAAPLSNTNSLTNSTNCNSELYSPWTDPKENASIVVLPVVCCVFIRPLLSNGCLTSVSTVD